jgi:hypothetical protein
MLETLQKFYYTVRKEFYDIILVILYIINTQYFNLIDDK